MTGLTTKELDPLVSQWFNIYPTGISIKDGNIPPVEAFDTLGYALAANADELRWQVASFCNLYKEYYPDIYQVKADQFFKKPQTIETWAYIERNVPPENRTTEKTIYHHRAVARIEDKQEQAEYMQHCVENNLSVRDLQKHVAKQRNEPIPPSYEDRQYQYMVDEHKAIEELTRINRELSLRLSEYEAQIKAMELAEYKTTAIKDLIIDRQQQGVTIYASGEVRWIP